MRCRKSPKDMWMWTRLHLYLIGVQPREHLGTVPCLIEYMFNRIYCLNTAGVVGYTALPHLEIYACKKWNSEVLTVLRRSQSEDKLVGKQSPRTNHGKQHSCSARKKERLEVESLGLWIYDSIFTNFTNKPRIENSLLKLHSFLKL